MNNTEQYYGNDTMEETIGERDQVRTRPSIYFGSNDLRGALTGVFEIITNGGDELANGYASKVRTTVEEDYDAIRRGGTLGSYIVTVADDGRGVPMDWNPKTKKFNWHMVYNQLFASGKRGAASAYSNAAGLNGVGASITQFTSEFMVVISRRKELIPGGNLENIEYEMHFKDGYPDGELIKRPWSEETAKLTGLTNTGTYVKFKTDASVFLDTRYSFEDIADRLRKLAVVAENQQYELKFMNEDPISFKFEHGLTDWLNAIMEDPIIKEPIRLKGTSPEKEIISGKEESYNVGIDVAISFSNTTPYVECFHNSTFVPENGTHYKGAIDGIKDAFEAFGQKEKQFTAKEKIVNSDIEDMLCIMCASTIDKGDLSAWYGQEKRAIQNKPLYGAFREKVSEAITEWLITHKEEGLRVITAIKLRKEAREKAEQIKKKLIKQITANANELKTRPNKLHDCKSRSTDDNEIYIVEGDSAEGSVITARNVNFQASYPLTGVILNCEKASPEKILANRVIRELIQIIGCGIEIPTTDKHMMRVLKDIPKYDLKNLNYGKIVILTDADLDGYHIGCLLIVFFAKLMPQLLKDGRVYLAFAPLFKITYADKSYKYIYTAEELKEQQAIDKRLGKKITVINRYKGLGEMDDYELAESVMDPATRRLEKVEFNDPEGFHKVMRDLLGDNLDERKAYIREYFEMVSEAEELAENEYMLENGTYD